MAVSTYAQLKASVASWLNRSDLTAVIPDFIRLAEEAIDRDLRIQKQLVSATLSGTGGVGSIALPSDWQQGLSLLVEGIPLQYRTAQVLRQEYTGASAGQPRYYTIEGGSMVVAPVPADDYSVSVNYYGKFAFLSEDADTNWLLTNHPSVYLFGALSEAELFLANDARLAVWRVKYTAAIEALNKTQSSWALAGDRLAVRSDYQWRGYSGSVTTTDTGGGTVTPTVSFYLLARGGARITARGGALLTTR